MPHLSQKFPYVLPGVRSDRRWCLRGIQLTLVVRLAARITSRALTLLHLAAILLFFMRGGAPWRMAHWWRNRSSHQAVSFIKRAKCERGVEWGAMPSNQSCNRHTFMAVAVTTC